MARFEGTENYVAANDLKMAVNAAITLERPLLIKGEPGTGKTVLAHEIAKGLGAPLIEWNVKSTTKAQQGLYEYDAVARLRDSQLGDDRVHDIKNYINKGKVWEAFESEVRPILLIDEIDKADIEFPNDLLHELDKMKETMTDIVKVHFPDLKQRMLSAALKRFFAVREMPGLKKKHDPTAPRRLAQKRTRRAFIREAGLPHPSGELAHLNVHTPAKIADKSAYSKRKATIGRGYFRSGDDGRTGLCARPRCQEN